MLVERYQVPNGTATAELVIKNSRFIGTVGRVQDSAAAHAFVAGVAQRYPDASHHAWAYRLSDGPQGEIGSSDDGEPGGTAGRPMLAVLEGAGLVQVAAVGTRYFGGIKLGTGGLVRAYRAAAREALARTPCEERVWHRLAALQVNYDEYGSLRHVLPSLGVQVRAESFAERVALELAVPYAALEQVSALLRDVTRGRLALEECWLPGAGVWMRPTARSGGAA